MACRPIYLAPLKRAIVINRDLTGMQEHLAKVSQKSEDFVDEFGQREREQERVSREREGREGRRVEQMQKQVGEQEKKMKQREADWSHEREAMKSQ